MRPIVFVDTETTSLGPSARPWEIALIRREPDGRELMHKVFQIDYELKNLPHGTSPEALHIGGWLTRGVKSSNYLKELPEGAVGYRYADERTAAKDMQRSLAGQPILVGVGVHFDAQILAGMFSRVGYPIEPWHYGLLDLKAATWGVLAVRTSLGVAEAAEAAASELPMRSEALAAAIGVAPPTDEERHTALGDARWAARWFDALTGGAQ